MSTLMALYTKNFLCVSIYGKIGENKFNLIVIISTIYIYPELLISHIMEYMCVIIIKRTRETKQSAFEMTYTT